MAIFPLLGMQLDRPYVPMIMASDASPEYGFGTSVCACTSEIAAELGSLSEKRGDFVRLRREPGEDDGRDRLGTPHVLGFSKSHFTDVLSIRARTKEHSGIMELRALLISVRRALRAAWRQDSQIVVLVDARVALCAAAKGRSSSKPLLYILRQLGALLFASGVHLRLVYVPSEDNPSDGASRGKRRRGHRSLACQVLSVEERRRDCSMMYNSKVVRRSLLKQRRAERICKKEKTRSDNLRASIMRSPYKDELFDLFSNSRKSIE